MTDQVQEQALAAQQTSAEQTTPVEKAQSVKFTLKSVGGRVIHLKTDKNPKRPSSKAYDIFALYFAHAPITVEEYLDLGARMCDIKCDVEKGYVELRAPEAAVEA